MAQKGEIPGVLVDSPTWNICPNEVKDDLLSKHNQTNAAPRKGAPAMEDTDQE